MASQGPNITGTAADDASIGAYSWVNPTNAQASDSTYAVATMTSGISPVYDYSVKLVVGGTISGTNQATSNHSIYGITDSAATWGSSTNLWGLTPAYSDVNGSGFGVAISFGSDISRYSHYLKCTNFGFTVPSGSTINGVVAVAYGHYSGGNGNIANIDYVSMTVYYTNSTGTVYTMTCTPSSFSYTTNTVTPTKFLTLATSAASYVLTGATTKLTKAWTMVCSATSYTLASLNTGFSKFWKMVCTPVTYTFTGASAVATRVWQMLTQAATYTYITASVAITTTGKVIWTLVCTPANYLYTTVTSVGKWLGHTSWNKSSKNSSSWTTSNKS